MPTFFKSKNVTLLTFQCQFQCQCSSVPTTCLPFLKSKNVIFLTFQCQCADGLLTFLKSKNVTLLTFQCQFQCQCSSVPTACLLFLKVKMLPCLPSNVPVFRRLAHLFLKVKMLPCLPSNASAPTAWLPFLKVKMLSVRQ